MQSGAVRRFELPENVTLMRWSVAFEACLSAPARQLDEGRNLSRLRESGAGTDYSGKSSAPLAGRLLTAGAAAPVAAVALAAGSAPVVAGPLTAGGVSVSAAP